MPTPSRLHSQQEHTIVLRSRVSSVPRQTVIGSKPNHLRDSHPVRHDSPSSGMVWSTGPPPRAPVRQPSRVCESEEQGGNLLVSFGIDSILGRMVTRVLLLLMCMQPVYMAFGMELEGDTAPASEMATATEAVEDVPEESGAVNTDVEQSATEVVQTEATSGAKQDPDTATTEEIIPATVEDNGVNEHSGNGGVDGGEGVFSEGNATSTESTDVVQEEYDTTVGNGGNDASGSQDEQVHATSTEVASTTEPSATSTEENLEEVPVVVAQNPDNKYVFGEGDCTVVADGEFYCVATGPERQPSGDPRVYAEKDREGDREIFYFDGVDVIRVTNNSYDDFAPMFDEATKRIVWQASVSDRLQIMLFEIETNTTRQITTGRHNSSNPDIEGDVVVWQEWIDTNWEIMRTSVDNQGAPFEIEQVTDNAVHDMFPRVYDDMVTWQREKGGSWEVVLFDLSNGDMHALEKNENTQYENPRFVLLFDSKHDNGDVETIGYDLESGDMMELGTKANRDPFVPVTPKDEVPDVPVGQNASSTQIKVTGREDGSDGDDLTV